MSIESFYMDALDECPMRWTYVTVCPMRWMYVQRAIEYHPHPCLQRSDWTELELRWLPEINPQSHASMINAKMVNFFFQKMGGKAETNAPAVNSFDAACLARP